MKEMKKSILLIAAILIGFYANAQDEYRTIFGDGNINKIRGFGGPMMGFTDIDGSFAHLMGGGGGVILNDKFMIGGFGYGLTNRIDAERTNKDGKLIYDDLYLEFGYGGMWFAYTIKGSAPIHPVINLQFGNGNISLVNSNNSPAGYSDNLFILNPAIELEMNITRFFRMSVGGNYRMAFGVNKIEGFEDKDFTRAGGFLAFKFGWF